MPMVVVFPAPFFPMNPDMPFGKHKGTPISQLPKHYVSWLKDKGVLDKQENETLKKSFEKFQLI